MDVLPKTFLQIILAAKWLVRHSIFIFELQMFGVILCEITPHFLPASRQREYAYTLQYYHYVSILPCASFFGLPQGAVNPFPGQNIHGVPSS